MACSLRAVRVNHFKALPAVMEKKKRLQSREPGNSGAQIRCSKNRVAVVGEIRARAQNRNPRDLMVL